MTDPELRASVLVTIAQGPYRETNPEQALMLLEENGGNSVSSDQSSDDGNKIQLAALLASVRAMAAQDDSELWDTLIRGLSLAEDLFQEATSGVLRHVGYQVDQDWDGPVYMATGFREANALIKIGMEKERANTLGWLAQQHDPALKSYLLISAAEGLWNAQKEVTPQ
jgi:hypothetical protein